MRVRIVTVCAAGLSLAAVASAFTGCSGGGRPGVAQVRPTMQTNAPSAQPVAVLQVGHTDDRVGDMAWDPSGHLLATADSLSVRVWEGVTGELRGALAGAGNLGTVRLSWRPDGAVIAVETAQAVLLWDLATDRVGVTLPCRSEQYFRHTAWRPDGQALAAVCTLASGESEVRVWDRGTTVPRVHVPIDEGNVGHVHSALIAWSPDGATLAVLLSPTRVTLVEAATGHPRAVLDAHATEVTALGWSPDGATLAVGAAVEAPAGGEQGSDADTEGRVQLWDVAHGVVRTTSHALSRPPFAVAVSPDGRAVAYTSAANGNDSEVWTPATDTYAVLESAGDGQVVQWRRDGDALMLQSSDSGTYWTLGNAAWTQRGRFGCQGGCGGVPHQGLAWSPDLTAVATRNDRGVSVWNTTASQPRLQIPGTPPAWRVFPTPDGHAVVATAFGTANGRWVRDLASGDGGVLPHGFEALSADGRYALRYASETTREVVVVATGVVRSTIAAPASGVDSLGWTFSPDGHYVGDTITAHGPGGDVPAYTVWDATTGARVRQIPLDAALGIVARWNPTSPILAVGSGNGGPQRLDSIAAGTDRVVPGITVVPAWSPDGRRFLSGRELWDAGGSTALEQLPAPPASTLEGASVWSRDGARVVLLGDHALRVWDVAARTDVATLAIPRDPESSADRVLAFYAAVAWDPSGAYLAAYSDDAVYIWDTRRWTQVYTARHAAAFDTHSTEPYFWAGAGVWGYVADGLRLVRLADGLGLQVLPLPTEGRAWVAVTAQGVFDGDAAGLPQLRFRRGPEVRTGALLQPDAVASRLGHQGLLRDYLAGRDVGPGHGP